MGLIGGGSCGLGLFIGCVRRFSSGAILCSACAICTCTCTCVTRRFSTSKTLCSAMRCKKVLCWCGRFTRRGGQESAEWQIPPPCTLLYFALQTNTQIHKYTNTQIHKYTNTQIQRGRGDCTSLIYFALCTVYTNPSVALFCFSLHFFVLFCFFLLFWATKSKPPCSALPLCFYDLLCCWFLCFVLLLVTSLC